MTITHAKVSVIPDGDDSSLVLPSDWNDDHVIDLAADDIPDLSDVYEPLRAWRSSLKAPWQPQRLMVATVQSGHTWATGSNLSASDLNYTADYALGTQCIRMVSAGAGATATINNTSVTQFDMTDRDPVIWAKVTDTTHLSQFKLRLGTNSSNYYSWTITTATSQPTLQSDEWGEIVLSWADSATTGSPDRSRIVWAQVAINDDAAGTLEVFFSNVMAVAEPVRYFPNGVVSFCFDDGNSTIYDNMRPTLDRYGWRGTFFPIVEDVDQSNYMTLAQIKKLKYINGWEVGSHAYTAAAHASGFTALTEDQIVTECEGMLAWNRRYGFDPDILAMPHGDISPTVEEVVRRYYPFARTTYGRKEVFPPARPHRLRGYSTISGYSGGTTLSDVQGYVDAAKLARSWLILIFHRVATPPTSTTYISQSDFDAICQYVDRSGMEVLPMGQVLAAAQGLQMVVPPPAYTALDNGLVGQTYGPESVTSSTTVATAGIINGASIRLDRRTPISNILMYIATGGGTLTSGQCFAAVWQHGRLLAQTTDQATAWAGTGLTTMPLASTVYADPGTVDVGVWFNGTTGPTFTRGNATALINPNLSGSALRFWKAGSGYTTTAPSTLPTKTTSALVAWWMGLS